MSKFKKTTPLHYINEWIRKNDEFFNSEIINEIKVSEEELNRVRDYVGMSSLGSECLRKVVLDYNEEDKKEFKSIKLSMICNMGNYIHGLLQYVCKKIWKEDCFIEHRVELEYRKGKIVAVGHIDVYIENFYDEEEEVYKNVLIDFKTISNQGYINVLAGHKKKKYWIQANGYRKAIEADECHLIYINRDSMDMIEIDVTDEMSATIAMQTAKEIQKYISKKTIPKIPYPSFAEGEKHDCMFCGHKDKCWSMEEITKENEKYTKENGIIYEDVKKLRAFNEDMEKIEALKLKEKEAKAEYKSIEAERKMLENKYRSELTSDKEKRFFWAGTLGFKKTNTKKEKLNEQKLKEDFGEKLRDYYEVRDVVSVRKIKKMPNIEDK